MRRFGVEGGRSPLGVAAALVAVSACDAGDAAAPSVPAALAIAPDAALLTYLGETVRFAATVGGGPGGAATVRWSSTDETVVTVDGSGVATARGNGTAEVRASAGGAGDAAAVRVEQRVASLRAFGGGQRAFTGLRLPESVGVLVRDAAGRPVAGTEVGFAVEAGGGSVDPVLARSDGSGVAAAAWTLGRVPGEQRLAASVAGGPEAAIRATAVDPSSVVERVVLWSGGGQWGVAGRPLAEPVAVRTLDGSRRPVPGALVRFAVGAGSVAPVSAHSDSLGLASTVWTLGAAAGVQTLAASVADAARLEVRATAQPDAGICGRTRAVIDELLRRTDLADCAEVTEEHLSSIYSMRLEDKNITSLRSGDFEGLRRLLVVHLHNNRLRALPPDIFAGRDSLLALYLGANQLDSLPAGMLAGLPRLTELSLWENRLTEVPSGLADLTRMRSLSLTSNPLGTLPSDLFARMARLESLSLANIELDELPPEIFRGLSGLRSLNVALNGLTRLPAGVFDDLSGLDWLTLVGNRLTTLPPGAFANLDALRVLYLHENELDRLPRDVFAGLSRLQHLGLRENRLSALPPELFRGLGELRTLQLRGNRLTALPPGLFGDLASLERLTLDNNQLAELPPGLFGDLASLERLTLDNNQLAELPPGIFAGLSNLDYLNLRWNSLTSLPPGIFAGLGRLNTLRLWSNALTSLPPGVFAGLGNLAELDLIGNELTELPPRVFAGLSSLERLSLWGNPGSPFPVGLELARTDAADALAPGPASVALRVPSGAPLFLEVPVTVQGGSGSKATLTVAAGDTAGAPLSVRRPAGRSGPVHVSLGAAPAFPIEFDGLEYVAGPEMVLFAPSDNRSPAVAKRVFRHWLQAGVEAAEIELAPHFSDPDGDTLSYAARSGDAAVVAARVGGGVLELEPLSAGSAEVEVTATDPGGLRASLSVPVTVAPAPDPDGYRIELVFADGATAAERFTEAEKAHVRRAAARWEEVVTGDLPDIPFDAGLCGSPVRLVGRIDDVVIRVAISDAGNINSIGQAADCAIRESGLAVTGVIWLNRYYYGPDAPETGPNSMYRVALHEMGHVLGIGLNAWRDMLREKTRDVPLDTHFPGPLAVEAFDEAGGRPYAGGKVPVDNGVSVAPNNHWRYDVLRGELMGPRGGAALSAITVRALADLGYEVDAGRADPYELPAFDGAAADRGAAESLFAGDVLEGPVLVVDEDGNVVRIIGN